MAQHQSVSRCLSIIAVVILVWGLSSPAQAARPLLQDVAAFAVGSGHACALTTAGGVRCWGNNVNGELGDGTNLSRGAPVDVVGLSSGVHAISAGWSHTCALMLDGSIKCWGDNQYGQLGDGTTVDSHAPVAVAGLSGAATAIAGGWGHSCAIVNGGLHCWGYNGHGELGDGTTTGRLSPAAVSGLTTGVRAVVAGSWHTCALTQGGAVKCWGSNATGEVGDGTTTRRLTPVSVSGLAGGVRAMVAGSHYNCALTEAGGMQCWGENYRGALGDGSDTQRSTPANVVGLSSGVAAMGAGAHHSCAILAAGGVRCWGDNQYGQVGDGTTTERHTPTEISGVGDAAAIAGGWGQTCALLTNGRVKCWGLDTDGQLGDGVITQRELPAQPTGLTGGMASIAAGWEHTCAADAAGVHCWGWNGYGQVGDGSASDRNLPTRVSSLASGVSAVAAGWGHSCAIVSGGLKCWGDNASGQLGDGTNTHRYAPVSVSGLASGVRAAAAGGYHSCALTTNGAVKCWGSNSSGQLGDGTTTGRKTPVAVSGLSSGTRSLTTGDTHSCAVTAGGGAVCWGSNSYGQLGDGTTSGRKTPVTVSGLTSGVSVVSAGSKHSCAVTNAGAVKCWGSNSYGQLGNGTTADSATPVAVTGLSDGVSALTAGWGHTCAMTAAGAINCWGFNAYGQLGDGSVTQRSAPVGVVGWSGGSAGLAAGTYHTCAISAAGGVWCWGRDSHGQLGLGTITERLTPVDVVAALFAPYAHLPLTLK